MFRVLVEFATECFVRCMNAFEVCASGESAFIFVDNVGVYESWDVGVPECGFDWGCGFVFVFGVGFREELGELCDGDLVVNSEDGDCVRSPFVREDIHRVARVDSAGVLWVCHGVWVRVSVFVWWVDTRVKV